MFKSVDETRIEQLDRDFASKFPRPEDAERYAAINEAAKAFAKVVIENVPWSVDRDRAVDRVRDAAMLAREAILTYEPPNAEEFTTKGGHKIRLSGR